jgi:hypothetical protein
MSCCAVQCIEAKLTCMQVQIFIVPLDCMKNKALLNNWLIMDRRLTGHRFWGNLGSLPSYTSFQGCGKWDSWKQWLNKCMIWTNGLLGRCLRHSFGMQQNHRTCLVLVSISVFRYCLTLLWGNWCLQSEAVLALASTHGAWVLSHTSWGVNSFSKQSAIALAFSSRWYWRPRGPWIAVGAHDPTWFKRDLATGQIPWGVTLQLPTFVSHCLSAFLWVILLIILVTQLTAVLQAESLVSCHNFLSLCPCFNSHSKLGKLLCKSERVRVLVNSL